MNNGAESLSAAVSRFAAAAVPTPEPAGVATDPRPLAPRDVANLVEMFERFAGAIPPRELREGGWDIPVLVRSGIISPPHSHLDFGCYGIGRVLQQIIFRQ